MHLCASVYYVYVCMCCTHIHRYLWGIVAHASSNFRNSAHSAAAARLAVKMSKITNEKHVLLFCLSCQTHTKIHVNRLKQSRNPTKISGHERRGKNLFCVPSPHFLATLYMLLSIRPCNIKHACVQLCACIYTCMLYVCLYVCRSVHPMGE